MAPRGEYGHQTDNANSRVGTLGRHDGEALEQFLHALDPILRKAVREIRDIREPDPLMREALTDIENQRDFLDSSASTE